MDHHRAAPYATLWSNIDTGIGSRTFASSGDGGANGNHTSSWSTFWNVRCVRARARLSRVPASTGGRWGWAACSQTGWCLCCCLLH